MKRPFAALALALVASSAAVSGAYAQSMEITRADERAGTLGSEEYFTGTAYVEPVFPAKEPFVVNAGQVTFLPGARSAWHTHPAGQMLVVTSGTGWVQERGEEKQMMQAGDVIWCPPGVEHWHGATDTTAVTHLAVQQFADGENVVWGEHVTDAEYGE